jgi:anti-sigma factor RsiW
MTSFAMPHLSKDALVRLRARSLPPEELLAAVSHLESCAECATRAEDAVEPSAAAEMWRGALDAADEDHLRDERLFDYADGHLSRDARAAAEAHLGHCTTCRDDVADIRALRGKTTRRRWQRYALAAAAVLLLAAGIAVALRLVPTSHPIENPRHTPIEVPTPAPIAEAPPAAWRELVDAAVANGRLAPPAILATLRMPLDVARSGEKGHPSVMAPDGVIVEDSRPELRWSGTPGAVYTVSLFDGDVEVARSAPLHENVWKPQRDLPRGRTYRWQVEARRDAKTWIIPMTPQAAPAFALLDEAAHRELDAARKRYPDDHLLLGVLAAHDGLQDEAIAELTRLQTSHPDARAAALLESVRAWGNVDRR